MNRRECLRAMWGGNWIAFNDAYDVTLPGPKGKPLPFLMYPQADFVAARLESLAPERFNYAITAREM
ncbi:MAG: hypothetical protein ABI024_14775 [Vicinamibacterales bacterium]